MDFNAPFVLPFVIGTILLFTTIAWKWGRWLWLLPAEDKRLAARGLFSGATLGAVGEVFSESLLHRRIFRINPVLGYMHMSLAFGWFLLIVVGWIETAAYLGFGWVPLHGHVFFKYFSTGLNHAPVWGIDFELVMDLLLLFVLSGVGLAYSKRLYSRMMGMRKTTRHTVGDRIALSALWLIFPARLLAESLTSAMYHSGSFLTGSFGNFLGNHLSDRALAVLEPASWWFYSIVLGVFFIALPFSRYMHIFTEIPLIFLRRWKLRSKDRETSYDQFQVQACSRCGICIDPCQLQRDAGIDGVQSVYFLRDRRYGYLTNEVADNCLMCGRCESRCPVGIELNTLRLNSREKRFNSTAHGRYDYLKGIDRSEGTGKVGYFAGCMTLLTPTVILSMERIFAAAGEEVWWADKSGGVCCGRPLKLSGEVEAARKMMDYNCELFVTHGISTLVTSCPICLKVFREEYDLPGIEVLHHSQYILRLIGQKRITPAQGKELFTYHDPCELGRGSGIYDEPRAVIAACGNVAEPAQTRENALCCGSSVANTAINDDAQLRIGLSVTEELAATGASAIVTACPLCKKALARTSSLPVRDLAEIVAQRIAPAAPNL